MWRATNNKIKCLSLYSTRTCARYSCTGYSPKRPPAAALRLHVTEYSCYSAAAGQNYRWQYSLSGQNAGTKLTKSGSEI